MRWRRNTDTLGLTHIPGQHPTRSTYNSCHLKSQDYYWFCLRKDTLFNSIVSTSKFWENIMLASLFYEPKKFKSTVNIFNPVPFMSLFGHALFNYNPPQAQQRGLVIFWVNGDYIGTHEWDRVKPSLRLLPSPQSTLTGLQLNTQGKATFTLPLIVFYPPGILKCSILKGQNKTHEHRTNRFGRFLFGAT